MKVKNEKLIKKGIKKRGKLKTLRFLSGLKVREVAENLGVSDQTVANWENGKCKIPAIVAQAMARMYDVPIEFLIEEKDTNIYRN